MIETRIITLHDLSGIPVLVNLDRVSYVRQSENCSVIYFTDTVNVKVSETLNEIGKFVSAKKYIG